MSKTTKGTKKSARHEAKMVEKYGPTRAVVKTLAKRAKSTWAKLECGHPANVNVGAKSWRCSKCRTEAKAKAAKAVAA